MKTLPTDIMHGVSVEDPYRWLEVRQSAETRSWLAKQQQRCLDYFGQRSRLSGLRTLVHESLAVETVDQPERVGGFDYYRKRRHSEEQAAIYRKNLFTGEEHLLVDPMPYGQFASLAIYRISPDGRYLAYECRYGGSKKAAIHILNLHREPPCHSKLETGHSRGFVFRPAGDGFYFCHDSDTSTAEHTIRLRRFDSPMSDQIVYRVPRSDSSRLILFGDSIHVGALCVHAGQHGTLVDFSITRIESPRYWTALFSNRDAPLTPVLVHGRIFAFLHDKAPNGRIVELSSQGRELQTLVPECQVPIQQFRIARSRIYVIYLDQLTSRIDMWNLNGSHGGSIPLPGSGSIRLLGTHGQSDDHCFYSFESYCERPSIYDYDPNLNESKKWHQEDVSDRAVNISIQNVMVRSRDDTPIPVSLVSRQEKWPTKPLPTVLSGYGAFGVSMTRNYSALVSIMTRLDVLFAFPHVRGGGEFGEEWHECGRGRRRQTSIDDFLAAASQLPRLQVSDGRMGAIGVCNGGLLVTAAMIQRPDLFRAVVAVAPFTDMIRYELFDSAAKWRHEYGTVSDPDDFHALYNLSPYHHVRPDVDYPATLFITGDQDDVSNPAHTRKMAALLQNRSYQKSPILVDYSEERGHSPTLPLSTRVESLYHKIVFLMEELRIDLPRQVDQCLR